MIISVVPPPISINATPSCFSWLSRTDEADANGSNISPLNSIPTLSRQVFKLVSIFRAIVTICTLASSLCPDKPSGFIMLGLSSTLNSRDNVCKIFL